MNNKEAIAVLRSNYPSSNYTMLIEAVELSIKSLEADELAQQTTNSAMDTIATLADKWCDATNQSDSVCVALYQFTTWVRQQHQ